MRIRNVARVFARGIVSLVAVTLIAGTTLSAAPLMRPNNIPVDPLFVADPVANAVYICDAASTGNVNCGNFRAGVPLDAPISAAAGHDCMANAFGCGNYVWVTNNNNNKINVFKIIAGFPLVCTISNSTLVDPVGVAQFEPAHEIVVANINNNALSTYHSNCPTGSPFVRQIIGVNTMLAGPWGPSIYHVNGADYVYVSGNTQKVLVFNRTASGNVAPVNAWTIGHPLEGTAVDPVAGLIWASAHVPSALWNCMLPPLGTLTGCPTTPTGATSLATPDFLSTSSKWRRVYVPNHGSRVVTSYNEFGTGAPVATYRAPGGALFTNPVGTAVLF